MARPSPPPEDDLMAVLRVAEELYQQDRRRDEARQERASFRLAAAEMGLGDDYLRRAVKELQARREVAFQRSLARRRLARRLGRAAATLALVVAFLWTVHAVAPWFVPRPRTPAAPTPQPLVATATVPAPVVLQPPTGTSETGGFQLLQAVNAHDNDRVQSLLTAGVDANSTTASFTPLIAAADHGYADTAQILLTHGANPNVRDIGGETPLTYASLYGYQDTVALLLRQGADPKSKNNKGWTALHYIAMHGNVPLMTLLLDSGADVNAVDQYGETPLMYAVADSRFAAVQLLLQRHADPNVRGFNNVSALGTARAMAVNRPGEADAMVQVLQAAGATP